MPGLSLPEPPLSVILYETHIHFQGAGCFASFTVTFADQRNLFRESPISVSPIGDLFEHCETLIKIEQHLISEKRTSKNHYIVGRHFHLQYF